MIGYVAIVWALCATVAGTEVFMVLRDRALREHIEWKLDREDAVVVVMAGLLWPMTLVAALWLRFYAWRKGRTDGAA